MPAQTGQNRQSLPPLAPLPSLNELVAPRDPLPREPGTRESITRERPRPAPLPGEGGMTCILEPRLVTEVGSPIDGVIEKVFVDRGDRVEAGQVVAKLKSGVEEAEIEVKRARVEFGRRKNERNEDLFKKQLISEQEKDEMETEYRVSRAELAKETENLKLRTILSPINGVVLDRYLWAGELIRADKSKVVKLAQIDPLNVEVVAPMHMFGSISRGANAEITLEPLIKGVHQAKVVIVDNVIDGASSTFGIRLELPNPGYKIPAGIRCRVRFR
ncbi:MAG: efflux RND transporter periplasmic adaptor subunit [Burkholderiales bacterium]